MLRPWLRVTILLSGLTFLLLTTWVTLNRAAQTGFPSILYSKNGVLYIGKIGCPSLFWCVPFEHELIGDMSTNPVGHWSPDGDYIAANTLDGWMIYAAACLLEQAGCPAVMLDPEANDSRLAWSPDGTILAYTVEMNESGGGTGLRLRTRGCWDGSPPRHCLVQTILLSSSAVLRHPAWSKDGRWLAFMGISPLGLYMLDMACLDQPDTCAAGLQPTLDVGGKLIFWPLFTARDEQIIYTVYDNTTGGTEAYLVNRESGAVESIRLAGITRLVSDLSHDGRYLVYSGVESINPPQSAVFVYDVDRRLSARATPRSGDAILLPAWSP